LDIELFEFAVIDHPGLEIGRSSGVEVHGIELEEHMLFVLELAQADDIASATGQGKIRGGLSNVYSQCQWRIHESTRQYQIHQHAGERVSRLQSHQLVSRFELGVMSR
jgi:hypothetical protein